MAESSVAAVVRLMPSDWRRAMYSEGVMRLGELFNQGETVCVGSARFVSVVGVAGCFVGLRGPFVVLLHSSDGVA